ncbi:hypothetical protein PR048_011154, partial [Dryococelus australis]
MPAVERILKMYSLLKSYFLSQEKCPALLHAFFSNECSDIWLKFVHVQAAIFNDSVKMTEGENISFTEVSHLLWDLINKYTNRLENDYIPLSIRNECLRRLVEDSLFDEVSYVSNYVDHDALKRWEEMMSSSVFGKLNKWQIPYKNCLAIVQQLLCLPGTNASTER